MKWHMHVGEHLITLVKENYYSLLETKYQVSTEYHSRLFNSLEEAIIFAAKSDKDIDDWYERENS